MVTHEPESRTTVVIVGPWDQQPKKSDKFWIPFVAGIVVGSIVCLFFFRKRPEDDRWS